MANATRMINGGAVVLVHGTQYPQIIIAT